MSNTSKKIELIFWEIELSIQKTSKATSYRFLKNFTNNGLQRCDPDGFR